VTRFLALAALLLWPAAATAQDFARARLDASPRHHEWAEVPSGERTVRAFVAYPERADKAPVVIVIHENRGLTDWVRSFADQLAEAGYIAVAPDLLSDFDGTHHRTADFTDSDAAREAIYALDPERTTRDLISVQRFAAGLPAADGRTVVMGFCWGGGKAFRFAGLASGLSATLVFYGAPPDEDARIRGITAPVYGFYGGRDERINATIPQTRKRMANNGKTYAIEIYDGAGHAFMRDGDDPGGDPANRKARDAAWVRLKGILAGMK
jgi:carboxymethylenebutenolidase